MMATESMNIFFSYSHRDTDHYHALVMHLNALERNGLIRVWRNRQSIGQDWELQTRSALKQADVIILLISSSFLESDAFSSFKNNWLEGRSRQDKVAIIPILLRQCEWQKTFLTELDMLPRNHVPILHQQDQEEAFCDIAKDIRAIVTYRLTNRWKDEADILYRQKHYEEALIIYNQILRLDSNNLSAFICKGNVCLDLHRYTEALQAYEQASLHRSILNEKEPENPTVEKQWYEQARYIYNQLLQENSYHAPPDGLALETSLENIPRTLLDNDIFIDISTAIQRNPINPFLHFIKGNLSFKLGWYQEALGAYEQAIRLKRNNDTFRVCFFQTLEKVSQREYQKLDLLARQATKKAHELRDNNW